MKPFLWIALGLSGWTGLWSVADDEADGVFVRAILEGDQAKIEAYLSGTPNPNARNRFGDTALIWAVYQGDLSLVQRLLRLGADAGLKGSYGKTALHWAAEKGIVSVMRTLLESGAKVDAVDERRRTPLLAAARHGQLAALRFLLKGGAELEHRDEDGVTSLALAIEHNRREVSRFLIHAGADLDRADHQGLTPLSRAVRKGRTDFFRSEAILKKIPGIEERIESQYITIPANLDEKPAISFKRLRARIHELVNRERIKHEREPLAYNERLEVIAVAHSRDMALRGFFAHINPDKESPTDRADRMGFSNIKKRPDGSMTLGIAENLYRGWLFSSSSVEVREEKRFQHFVWCDLEELAEKAVAGWMGSPGHRENLLSGRYESEGIGIETDDDHHIFITQNFF